jgi:acyl-CoA synthetase (NDP forming)
MDAIPGAIDFAIIAVAARAVPEALEACRKKGVAGAEILSAGFKELGTAEGIALENEIKRIAARGIRVIGPNCFGIYCPRSGLTILPGPDLSRETGPVAFLSQSGGMAVDFANEGKSIGVRFSKVVSFGNGADLRETELLAYLRDDPETSVITMYVEGIEDGDQFFSTLKSAARKKPVIVYKGGLSEAGRRSVVSHTASMGGSRAIWNSILKQTRAVQVQDMPEMAQAALAFAFLPQRVYRNLTLFGGGGALGVSAGDAAETFGLSFPPFASETVRRMMAILPQPGSSAGNPVDVANPFVDPAVLCECLRIGAQDDRIDLQILISLLGHYKNLARYLGKPLREVAPFEELAEGVRKVAAETGKPIVITINNPRRSLDHLDVVETVELARKAFLERGIQVFDDLRNALRAISHVNEYAETAENRAVGIKMGTDHE